MIRPRKDYGCPLRIYHAPKEREQYTILPPRSGRAIACFTNNVGMWDCLAIRFAHGIVSWHTATAQPGPHLGQRIHWNELPAEVQHFARLSFLGEYCPPVQPTPKTSWAKCVLCDKPGPHDHATCDECVAAGKLR